MEENVKKKSPIIELLVVIVNRDEDENTIKILDNLNVDLQLLSLGKGTADSSLSDYLGFDIKEKTIIFSIIKLKDSDDILKILNEKFNFKKKNTGVALTIPIKSATYSLIDKLGFVFEN
ncbi:MAG: hypothetical protein EOM55_03445 [Clostridia bacterium]|nr:hypothetical protein [Clostridia bacterium]